MIDLDEIKRTVQELERGETSFASCSKLASLYIVLDHLNQAGFTSNDVVAEYRDILPHYTQYCSIKADYQRGKISIDNVLVALSSVCKEISEFLSTLYSNTDSPDERIQIKKCIRDWLNNT